MSRRATGFPPNVVDIITARSNGHCEVMANGCRLRAVQLHHRRPRGMGGTRRASTNTAAAGLHVCQHCHAYIERWRTWALEHGYLVSQHRDPAEVRVFRRSAWVLLTNDGHSIPVPAPVGGTA